MNNCEMCGDEGHLDHYGVCEGCQELASDIDANIAEEVVFDSDTDL